MWDRGKREECETEANTTPRYSMTGDCNGIHFMFLGSAGYKDTKSTFEGLCGLLMKHSFSQLEAVITECC
jgi:hypothetical protein